MNSYKPPYTISTSDGEFSPDAGYLVSAQKDKRSVTANWDHLQVLIDGVQVKEVKNVLSQKGSVLTELFRADWNMGNETIAQVFQKIMQPLEISGWHSHQFTTDRIFVNHEQLQIVLYDARVQSASYGYVNEFYCGMNRPALIVIPPGVWHAVHNPTNKVASLINMVDKAYCYDDPDHWRLPIDTDKIPFKFK